MTGIALGTLWRAALMMATLLAAGLMMGQRKMGDLSLFDMLTGITIGTVAGAGIIDTHFHPLQIIIAIMSLALLDTAISWAMVRWRAFGRAITFEPIVVVRHGQPVVSAMRRTRLAVADLLPELRKKDIFDLREVEYAIFEPDGSISVMKAPQAPKPKGLPQVVVVDGAVDEMALRQCGWDAARLEAELTRQGHPSPAGVFVATLDEAGTLVAAPRHTPDGPTLHH